MAFLFTRKHKAFRKTGHKSIWRRTLPFFSLGVIAFGVWYGFKYSVNYFSQEAAKKVAFFSRNFGAEYPQAWFSEASLKFPNAVEWTEVGYTFRRGGNYNFLANADRVILTAREASFTRFLLVAENVRVQRRPMRQASSVVPISFQSPRVEFNFSLNPAKFESEVKRVAKLIVAFIQGELVAADIVVNGWTSIPVRGKKHKAQLYSIRESGGTRLVMNEDDVIEIAKDFGQKLNETEIVLISRYPTRIATLLKIQEQASEQAEAEYSKDKSFPGDAYRHVLWSYLLTREYGDMFAKLVTDAHEEGEQASQGEARRMDLNNNEIGRYWAKEGIPEARLRQMVLNDPRVIRQLSESSVEERVEYSVK